MVADTRVVREDSDADAKLLVEVEVWLAVPALESKFDPSILVVSKPKESALLDPFEGLE